MKYFELEPEQNTFDLLVADITHKCNIYIVTAQQYLEYKMNCVKRQ